MKRKKGSIPLRERRKERKRSFVSSCRSFTGYRRIGYGGFHVISTSFRYSSRLPKKIYVERKNSFSMNDSIEVSSATYTFPTCVPIRVLALFLTARPIVLSLWSRHTPFATSSKMKSIIDENWKSVGLVGSKEQRRIHRIHRASSIFIYIPCLWEI